MKGRFNMENNGTSVAHKIERKGVEIIINKMIKELDKDRAKEIDKLIDLGKKFYGKDYKEEDYERYRKMMEDPNGKWMKIINSFLDDYNPNVVKM